MNRNQMRQAARQGEARERNEACLAWGTLIGHAEATRVEVYACGRCHTHTCKRYTYIAYYIQSDFYLHTHTYIIKLMKQAALDALGHFGGRS